MLPAVYSQHYDRILSDSKIDSVWKACEDCEARFAVYAGKGKRIRDDALNQAVHGLTKLVAKTGTP